MAKNLLLFFIFLINVVSSKTEYDYEEIDEMVPKHVVSNNMNYSFYKIYKYHIPFNQNSKTTNITIHLFSNNYFNIYLYNNFDNIAQDARGYFKNYISNVKFNKNIIRFNNLNCNTDYYFVFDDSTYYSQDVFALYLQVTFINEETDIINLNPKLSHYYSIIPRNENKEEKLNYCFNETKYTLIQLIQGNLTIKEEEDIIITYNNKTTFKKMVEFKKDKKYTILYQSTLAYSPIDIQFFNEKTFLKHDMKKRPIVLLGTFNYDIEIDISEYEIGEYIVLETNNNDKFIELKYQYKDDLKQNNFIYSGKYYQYSYILIKKTKNVSSLLLYITTSNENFFSLIQNMLKVKEITFDANQNNQIFKGPQLLLIDYSTINNLVSFGIESNYSYCFYEQEIDSSISFGYKYYYGNITIYKKDNYKDNIFKRAFIYFNTSDYISITFQKFNFYILSQNFGDIILNKQYLQICQGNNSPKELYFYVNNDKKENRYNYIDIFIPVLGNYDSFFINEKEIKTLSDFNFNNIKESNFFQISKSTDSGYLKIKCEKPAMVNHICITGDYDLNLTSGKRYIFPKSRVREYNFTFEEKLINKSITLKFTLFGSSKNTSIEFYLNKELKILNNTTPLELLYKYEYYNPNLINFKNNIEEDFCIEIIVGFLEEDLELHKQIDFANSL